MRFARRFAVGAIVALMASSLVGQTRLEKITARYDHLEPLLHQTVPRLDEQGVLRSGGICATREYSPEEIAAIEHDHRLALDMGRISILSTYGTTVKVNFHVITDGSKGKVSAQVLRDTITQLNATFAGTDANKPAGAFAADTGISFAWNNPTSSGEPIYYNNKSWYSAKPGSRQEADMKKTIASKAENDPRYVYNIYVNSPGVYMGGTLLGWATFPWELESNPLMDGVVMNNIALNHGGTNSYNAGDVVAHETGHWLGLFHTFQNGCTGTNNYDPAGSGQGDLVSDTPPESSYASGCPTGRDSCAGDGADPIENYMDYTSDQCQWRFTAGQDSRIVAKSGLRAGIFEGASTQ
jgi:hypothetical protein